MQAGVWVLVARKNKQKGLNPFCFNFALAGQQARKRLLTKNACYVGCIRSESEWGAAPYPAKVFKILWNQYIRAYTCAQNEI